MALNSFHKYVSAIRKSNSFKPVIKPVLGHSGVVAICKDTRYSFGGMLIGELHSTIGSGLVITSDHKTNELYAYDFWMQLKCVYIGLVRLKQWGQWVPFVFVWCLGVSGSL